MNRLTQAMEKLMTDRQLELFDSVKYGLNSDKAFARAMKGQMYEDDERALARHRSYVFK